MTAQDEMTSATGASEPHELAVPPTARRTRRRRRPTGAAPPLPRSIGTTGKGWLAVLVVLVVWIVVVGISTWARRVTGRVDAALLEQIARLRADWLTPIMRAIDRVGTGYIGSAIAMGLIVALLVFRRWRHLFTLIGATLVVGIVCQNILYAVFSRPRVYEVTIIGRWAGYSFPSPPVAAFTIFSVGIVYTMVVAGRPRTIAKAVLAAAILTFVAARLYLAVDHPSDALVGAAIAIAVGVNFFRFFTPNESFPVTYRRGKTAHLDVGGQRGEAVRRAVQDQLGLTVVDLKPVGLAGSGGSTPLRLRVAGDPDTYLFAKLYAMNHVRADRWYKTGRTILYGRLEDEAPFQSVRRLVEYEDYALRLVRDSGIKTAQAYGIVEMTPEREYLLVTEFFDGAKEIGDAEVDDGVIDQGLMLIRELWDAGLAHRDIKPANLLVRDGELKLIDVAFVQVRPSPWRQAVDLANMMLVLAVRTDAQRVYEHALRYFTPDEIAEAFAATRGVASPTQLRAAMKSDGRDLVAQFRSMAPARRPISLQRWGIRRFVYVAALLIFVAFAVNVIPGMLSPSFETTLSGSPDCGTGNMMVLMAQSVPSATSVPCLAGRPAGWQLGGVQIRNDRGRFWLDSDRAGGHALEVSLLRPKDCSTASATEVPSDVAGMRRFEQPQQLPPQLRTTRYYTFPGGCIVYEFSSGAGAEPSFIFAGASAVGFQARDELVDVVRHKTGLSLCGAGAPKSADGS